MQVAYFNKISLTVFSSPRRSISSRNARTFRGGTHQASSDVKTSFFFSSGTFSQNSWSRGKQERGFDVRRGLVRAAAKPLSCFPPEPSARIPGPAILAERSGGKQER